MFQTDGSQCSHSTVVTMNASLRVGKLVQMLHGTVQPFCQILPKFCQSCKAILPKFAHGANFASLPTLQAKDFARSCKSCNFARDCKQSCKEVQPNLLAKDFACQHALFKLLQHKKSVCLYIFNAKSMKR